MSDQRVNLSVENGVAYVTLNRPDKFNAIDMPMFVAIDKTIKQIKDDRNIRVVIVTGAGANFCTGLDIKSVLSSKSDGLRLLWKWLPGNANLAQRVSIGWRRLKVPVIMTLHGKCWGGGMQIALGGDFRIAATECSLAIMETQWGLIPDMGGTPGLRECVTADHGMKLAMTSEVISATQALAVGLITQIAEDPLQASQLLAQQLIERSPDTNSVIKKMYHKIWGVKERKILALETLNQIKIILGKNQSIAVKRNQGHSDIDYKL